MLSVVTLPVLVALSTSVPAPTKAPAPEPAQQKANKTAQVDVITCPLNGEQIPSCCCPVKK